MPCMLMLSLVLQDAPPSELSFSPSAFLHPLTGSTPAPADEYGAPLKCQANSSPVMLSISPFMQAKDPMLPVAAVTATPPGGTVGWADHEPAAIFALPPPTLQAGYTVRSLQSSSSTQQSGRLHASIGSNSIVFA